MPQVGGRKFPYTPAGEAAAAQARAGEGGNTTGRPLNESMRKLRQERLQLQRSLRQSERGGARPNETQPTRDRIADIDGEFTGLQQQAINRRIGSQRDQARAQQRQPASQAGPRVISPQAGAAAPAGAAPAPQRPRPAGQQVAGAAPARAPAPARRPNGGQAAAPARAPAARAPAPRPAGQAASPVGAPPPAQQRPRQRKQTRDTARASGAMQRSLRQTGY